MATNNYKGRVLYGNLSLQILLLVTLTVLTSAQEYPEITSFNTTFVTSTTVGLSWNKPGPFLPTYGYALLKYDEEGVCLEAWFLSKNNDPVIITSPGCNSLTTLNIGPFTEVQTFNVKNLESNTDYRFTISVWDRNNLGPNTSVEAQTSIGVPTPPQLIEAKVINSSAIDLVWTIPPHFAGPTDYTVLVYKALGRFTDHFSGTDTYKIIGYMSNTLTVSKLDASWRYTFSVTASTSAGTSNKTFSKIATTLPTMPGPVETIQVHYISIEYMAVNLVWDCPLEHKRNGHITHYTVKYGAEESMTLTTGSYYPEDRCEHKHSMLLPVAPNTNYTITVNANAEFTGVTSTINFYADLNKLIYAPANATNPETVFNNKKMIIAAGVTGPIILILLVAIASKLCGQ